LKADDSCGDYRSPDAGDPHDRYHDDPVSVPQKELRSTAYITVPEEWIPHGELAEAYVEGGRYARIVHTGPYAALKTAYDWL
jgi:AraC family transcriptional regulator